MNAVAQLLQNINDANECLLNLKGDESIFSIYHKINISNIIICKFNKKPLKNIFVNIVLLCNLFIKYKTKQQFIDYYKKNHVNYEYIENNPIKNMIIKDPLDPYDAIMMKPLNSLRKMINKSKVLFSYKSTPYKYIIIITDYCNFESFLAGEILKSKYGRFG